jgi:CAAX protease family protein
VSRRGELAFAVGAGVVLGVYNNVVGAQAWHRRWYPAVNALAAAGALGAAVASGLTVGELGLGRDRVRAGLRLGAAAAAPVVAGYGVGALVPATRPLLDDQRVAGLGRGELAYQVLVRIPVGTVVWEEVAFRGVLRAALRRVVGEPAATVAGSVVFGLWHVRPTVEALEVNGVAVGRGARVAAVCAVGAGTAGAGALLSMLRERSGSLAAPVVLHLAANCVGPLASAATRRTAVLSARCRADRRHSRPGQSEGVPAGTGTPSHRAGRRPARTAARLQRLRPA